MIELLQFLNLEVDFLYFKEESKWDEYFSFDVVSFFSVLKAE